MEMQDADTNNEVKCMKITSLLQGITPLKYEGKGSNKQEQNAVTVGKETPLTEIRALFRKHNAPLDDTKLKEIDSFFNEAEGSKEDKLKTLDMALEKGVSVDQKNLEEIHMALKSQSTDLVLTVEEKQVEELSSTGSPREVAAMVKHLKLPEEVKLLILEKLESGMPLKEALSTMIQSLKGLVSGEMKMISEKASLGDLIKTLQLMVSKLDPKVLMAWAKGESLVVFESEMGSQKDSENHQKVSSPQVTLSEDFFKGDSNAFENRISKEKNDFSVSEKREIGDEITSLDGDFQNSESDLDIEATEQKIEMAITQLMEHLDEMVGLVSQSLDIKVYLVEETTKATLEAKATFVAFQKSFDQLLEVKPPQEMKENLDKAIATLDKLLLKTTVAIFGDMHMERDLLKASAKLDLAKNAFKMGDVAQAKTILAEVKTSVSKINFNPSMTRIEAFATSKIDKLQQAFDPRPLELDKWAVKQIQFHQNEMQVKSSKDVMETLRFMGLSHEVELAETLEGKTPQKNSELFHANIKEILLKLMKDETDSRVIEKTENHLMNLAGQQSMTQQDGQNKRAFHFFNFPVEKADGAIGDMKVFLQSDKNGAKMDAQNASLYFVVQIKDHGEVGIRLKVTAGKCDMTLLSDEANALKPYFQPVFDALSEMGFEAGKFEIEGKGAFEKTSGSLQKTPFENQSYSGEKGFDFKI